MKDLKQQLLSISKTISSGIDEEGQSIDICDYMQDVMDINYILNADKTYKGARLLIAFGGPNIWIDTQTKTIEGYWWNEKEEVSYHCDALGLDDYCEEYFNC